MGTSRFTETKGHSEIKVKCGFTVRQKKYMKCFSQTKRYIPVVLTLRQVRTEAHTTSLTLSKVIQFNSETSKHIPEG